MRKNKIENLLKRSLKRKVSVTLGLVVTFMITGSIGYSEDFDTLTGGYNQTGEITLTEDSNAKKLNVMQGGSLIIKGNYRFFT